MSWDLLNLQAGYLRWEISPDEKYKTISGRWVRKWRQLKALLLKTNTSSLVLSRVSNLRWQIQNALHVTMALFQTGYSHPRSLNSNTVHINYAYQWDKLGVSYDQPWAQVTITLLTQNSLSIMTASKLHSTSSCKCKHHTYYGTLLHLKFSYSVHVITSLFQHVPV